MPDSNRTGIGDQRLGIRKMNGSTPNLYSLNARVNYSSSKCRAPLVSFQAYLFRFEVNGTRTNADERGHQSSVRVRPRSSAPNVGNCEQLLPSANALSSRDQSERTRQL